MARPVYQPKPLSGRRSTRLQGCQSALLIHSGGGLRLEASLQCDTQCKAKISQVSVMSQQCRATHYQRRAKKNKPFHHFYQMRWISKHPYFLRLCTVQQQGRFHLWPYLYYSLQLHSTWKAKQSEESASQHYEGQSWGLWTDARLRERILKEFNKADYRLQGLCMYV